MTNICISTASKSTDTKKTSRLEKTPNNIASNRKNAKQESFVLLVNDIFQHCRTQVGISNEVNNIIIRPRPSRPKTKLILKVLNH